MRKRALDALRYTRITPATHPALCALLDFAAQRPGLDCRNYGTWESYRAEAGHITRQWGDLVNLVRIADYYGLSDTDVIDASQWAYSGRLTWTGADWEYCTGQYWPCEYRTAAIAVVRAAIREHEWEVNNAAHA
ncbi:MAG: hypothetical protein BWY76_02178 [bacterium ADurb.Bin429]|nr:MAG: hypothetical protein BWY76_02178 [bacterium ADurb.Bin429]